MALDLVTGYKGKAHITAEDIGAFNAGVVGSGEYVLNTGNKLSASLVSSNTVKILDGDLVMQGRHVTLKKNTFEELTIENGENGMNRNDLIVARYTKDSNTGVEDVKMVVIKGTATTGQASDPEYTAGDILSGDCILHEMPLYRISLSSWTVGEPEALFEIAPPLDNFNSLQNVIPFDSSDEDTPEKWAEMGNGTWSVPLGKTNLIKGLYSSQYGVLINALSKNKDSDVRVCQILCGLGTILYRSSNGFKEWSSNSIDVTGADVLWNKINLNYSLPFVSGTYTGNGNTIQKIDLGFAPAAVLVARSDGSMARSHWGSELGTYFYGGLATLDKNCLFWDGVYDRPIITLTDKGFDVYCSSTGEGSAAGHVQTNSKATFSYIAFKG